MTWVPLTSKTRLARIPGALDALRRIADCHAVTVDEVLSKTRRVEVVEARHQFIHVLKSSTGFTVATIAVLVDRDRMTVRHADAKYARLLAEEHAP